MISGEKEIFYTRKLVMIRHKKASNGEHFFRRFFGGGRYAATKNNSKISAFWQRYIFKDA